MVRIGTPRSASARSTGSGCGLWFTQVSQPTIVGDQGVETHSTSAFSAIQSALLVTRAIGCPASASHLTVSTIPSYGSDEPVVVLELVVPVPSEAAGRPRQSSVAYLPSTVWSGMADAGPPLLVARGAAREAGEGVAHGAEDELDRVDERAVEIEEEGRFHLSKLLRLPVVRTT